MSVVDDLWQRLKDLWDKTARQMVYVPIESGQTDVSSDYIPIEAGRHYVRLWLANVYLAKQVQYFQSWYPAVHAVVRFEFQGQPVDFPTVADASKAGLTQEASGDVIARNFVLTPLIPFNGGTVSLDAGLIAVQGANHLKSFISTLSSFSDLLAVPQFSSALNIAAPLATGLQALLNDGGLQLALHDGFTAGRAGGYWAAIRATETDIDRDQLAVVDGQLRLGTPSAPLEGFDHLLFRLEVTEVGPDYKSLTSISGPMRAASDALALQETDKADGFYRAAIVAAHEAPELTTADRSRVKTQLKNDYQALKEDLGFAGLVGSEYDLTARMKLAKSVDEALVDGEPSWAELFNV
jgi:hypothetical protein